MHTAPEMNGRARRPAAAAHGAKAPGKGDSRVRPQFVNLSSFLNVLCFWPSQLGGAEKVRFFPGIESPGGDNVRVVFDFLHSFLVFIGRLVSVRYESFEFRASVSMPFLFSLWTCECEFLCFCSQQSVQCRCFVPGRP